VDPDPAVPGHIGRKRYRVATAAVQVNVCTSARNACFTWDDAGGDEACDRVRFAPFG
jgi:hypothetical protein